MALVQDFNQSAAQGWSLTTVELPGLVPGRVLSGSNADHGAAECYRLRLLDKLNPPS